MIDLDINKKYHVDAEGEVIVNGEGNPIPIYVCTCFARDEVECCCGAWYMPLPEEEDD